MNPFGSGHHRSGSQRLFMLCAPIKKARVRTQVEWILFEAKKALYMMVADRDKCYNI